MQQHVAPYALGGFIIPLAHQTTSRSCYGSCRTKAFTLQTGNIFLINRSNAASIVLLDRCPPVSSLSLSCLLASRSVCRHGGRFSVNLKGIAEKRACSRNGDGDAVIGCSGALCYPYAVSIATLVVPSAADGGGLTTVRRGREPTAAGWACQQAEGLRRCGYRLNYRPIQSEAGDRRRVR